MYTWRRRIRYGWKGFIIIYVRLLADATVLPRSIEDGVFSPGLVCLHYPGLDPRVCLGCPVFLNGDEIPGSSLLTGPLNLKAQSLITQSSIDRGNTVQLQSVSDEAPIRPFVVPPPYSDTTTT